MKCVKNRTFGRDEYLEKVKKTLVGDVIALIDNMSCVNVPETIKVIVESFMENEGIKKDHVTVQLEDGEWEILLVYKNEDWWLMSTAQYHDKYPETYAEAFYLLEHDLMVFNVLMDDPSAVSRMLIDK